MRWKDGGRFHARAKLVEGRKAFGREGGGTRWRLELVVSRGEGQGAAIQKSGRRDGV